MRLLLLAAAVALSPARAFAGDWAPSADLTEIRAGSRALRSSVERSREERARPRRSSRVIFVVEAFGDDPVFTPAVQRAQAQRIVERARRLSPEAEPVVLYGSSNDDVRRSLAAALRERPGAAVDALMLDSHGNEGFLANHSHDFSIYLESPSSILEALGPAAGRFSDGARVVLFGCQVLKDGPDRARLAQLMVIAETLKLRRGSVYANQQKGSAASDTITSREVWEQNEPRLVPLRPLLLPAAFLGAWLADNTVTNHGYSLIVELDAYTLVKDNGYLASGRPALSRHVVLQQPR